MEPVAGNNFTSYMHRLGFEQCRMGFLYGTVDETNQVKVEVVYEPPQESTHEGFELLEDPRAERVEALAQALKLQKVGDDEDESCSSRQHTQIDRVSFFIISRLVGSLLILHVKKVLSFQEMKY